VSSWFAAVSRGVETAALVKLRPDHRRSRATATAVSEAASGGRVWLALSAAGALHPTVRPAARDGLVAWAAASGVAFAVKSVAGRRRPRMPGGLGSSPSSSSMPSSHTAGAAAYAVAATLRVPAVGVVVVPAAVAVGWSRAATGRHFPTDVAVGAIVGAAVGGVVHTMARRFEHAASASRDGRPQFAEG
jgi:membrane-associated phospholipid phosphatase